MIGKLHSTLRGLFRGRFYSQEESLGIMTNMRKFLPLAAVAALAMAVAGCSSSDNDSATGGGDMPAPALTLATVEGMGAIAPGTYTPDADLVAAFASADEGLLGMDFAAGTEITVGGIDLECGMGTCSVTDNGDGTVTVVGTIYTAGYTPPPSDEQTAEMKVAEAMRIAAAIAPGSERADANADTPEIDELPFDFSHADGGKLVDFPINEETTDDFAMSDDSPAAIDGWAGARYERLTTPDDETSMEMDESEMDRVVTYTDQADPTDAVYTTYYSVDDRDGVGGTADATTGMLSLNVGEDTGDHMLFDVDLGLNSNDQNIMIPLDDPDTMDEETQREFKGTFTGVDGTFTCTASCMVSSDSDGNFDQLGGTWTFTPTVAEDAELADLMALGVTPDPDYLTFGYWVRTTQGEDGAEYAVQAFAEGNRDAIRSVGDVTGTAKYAGPATGLYMIKTVGADGMPMPITGGQFTAMAELTANFGGTAVAMDEQFMIDGTVSDFKDGYGNDIDTSWTVMLNRNAPDADDAVAANIVAAGTFSGPTVGMGSGGPGLPGTYEGAFHGDPTVAADQPTAASGIFDGHFLNGHVLGAFGANLVEEE